MDQKCEKETKMEVLKYLQTLEMHQNNYMQITKCSFRFPCGEML